MAGVRLSCGCWWAGWMLVSRVDLTLVKGSDTSGSLPSPLRRMLLFDRGKRIMWVKKAFEAALFYWKVYTSPCFPSLWIKGFTVFWRFMQKLHSVWSPLSFVDEAGIFGSCWNSLEFWVPSNPEQRCWNLLFFFSSSQSENVNSIRTKLENHFHYIFSPCAAWDNHG